MTKEWMYEQFRSAVKTLCGTNVNVHVIWIKIALLCCTYTISIFHPRVFSVFLFHTYTNHGITANKTYVQITISQHLNRKSLPSSNWNLKMLVSVEGTRVPGARREPTTNLTHLWHSAGLEFRGQWWKVFSPLRRSCPLQDVESHFDPQDTAHRLGLICRRTKWLSYQWHK